MRCTVPRTGASSEGRMPVGSPAWSTVYAFVSRWREQGLAQSSTTSSTDGRDRPSGVRWGRQQGSSTHSPCGWPRPSAPQLAAGDNGKKVGGPNRRISVGCLGMSLLVVLVTGANAQDSNAGDPAARTTPPTPAQDHTRVGRQRPWQPASSTSPANTPLRGERSGVISRIRARPAPRSARRRSSAAPRGRCRPPLT